MTRVASVAVVVACAIAFWQVLVWATGVPPFILPGPGRVATALWEARALLAQHFVVTAAEVLAGIALGSVLGALTAVQLVAAPRLGRAVMPLLVFTQAVPVFALAPLLTLWLGYGVWSKIAMTLLIIYFPVASAFLDGLGRTDPGLLDLARTMGAGRGRTLLFLRLPAALPAFASGLRLAAVYAPIGAVIGEWVGASQGLGYLMLLANGRAKTDLMFAALIVLALMTVALHAGVGALGRRLDAYAAGRREAV
ncbi:ABC transporter permease [Limibaculum sp. M0105]|uniref:ABC transporter permease n=1 Tax=Thermohalobaculum xanthum TaxID=2753746 RepID=A0A8J7SFR9_9RHOB|nr:ABC transporter permease [Thermohalobaculum xanthum]MBK0400321.1 ABC transporter permease [Thermohalobaculum xanthum]